MTQTHYEYLQAVHTENSEWRDKNAPFVPADFLQDGPFGICAVQASNLANRKMSKDVEPGSVVLTTSEYTDVFIALRTLRNESKGTLKAHEVAIGYDHGNSNWACLERSWEMADKALEILQRKMEEK